MIDSVWKRAIFSVMFFWIGIHAVGFGMTENGFDHPRNPVWAALSEIFQAEIMILHCLFWCGVAVGAIFVVSQLCRMAFAQEKITADINNPEKSHNTGQAQTEKFKSAATKLEKQNHQPADSAPSDVPIANQAAQKPEPPKPPPDPGALKQKAIDQILRGY